MSDKRRSHQELLPQELRLGNKKKSKPKTRQSHMQRPAPREFVEKSVTTWTPQTENAGPSHSFSEHVYHMGFSHFKEKWRKLDKEMGKQKAFINMIIHDLRSPTSQIQHAVSSQRETLELLKISLHDLMSSLQEDSSHYSRRKSDFGQQQHGGPSNSNPENSQQRGFEVLGRVLESNLSLFQLPEDLCLAEKLLGRIQKLASPQASNEQILINPTQPASRRQSGLAGSKRRCQRRCSVENESQSSDDEANARFESEVEPALLNHSRHSLLRKFNQIQQLTPKLLEDVVEKNEEINSSSVKIRNGYSPFKQNTSAKNLFGPNPQSVTCSKLELDDLQRAGRESHRVAQLDGIITYVDSLNHMVSSCEYSTAILLNLINDLLDLAKAENNAFSIAYEFFDLRAALEEAIASLSFLSQEKSIETSLVPISEDISVSRIFADSGRLKQVIVNLMSNALKFTAEGGKVELRVQASRLQSFKKEGEKKYSSVELEKLNKQKLQKISLCIEVKDNGSGISKEGQRQLFKSYASLQEHQKENKRGTGLGLCICKQIIDKLGGTIEVESEVGVGSTFRIRLELFAIDEEAEPQQKEGDTELESSSSSSNSLSEYPSKDITVEEAKEDPILFSPQPPKLSQLARIRHPSMRAAPLSFQQSNLNLLGVIEEAHSCRENKLELPEIIREKGSFKFKRSQSRKNASFNSSVHKRPSETLSFVMDLRWTHLKVLIVNDEPVSLLILQKIFSDKLGVEALQTASNGQQAVSLANQNYFDLILMDLHMPILDGFEATRQIKQNPKNEGSVMVALSASSFTEDLVLQCRSSGFQAWMTAPINLQHLVERILECYFPIA